MNWKLENDLSMIVAVDEGGGFAKGRTIPWSYAEDWKHFKSVTANNICIMGRGTYEDIAERRSEKSPNFRVLLPGRESYVVSSTLSGSVPRGTKGAFPSTRQILDHIHLDPTDSREIYVLGGRRLYIQHLATAKQIWMTIVPGYHDCNKRFPVELLKNDYTIVEGRKENGLMFVRYGRNLEYYQVFAGNRQNFGQLQQFLMARGVIEEIHPHNMSLTVNSLSNNDLAQFAAAGISVRKLNKVYK